MLLIDTREESGEKTLATHPLLSPISRVCKLDSADVAFTGNGPEGNIRHGIELKSITDLLQSIDSKRLQGQGGQLQRMLKTYDVCWLLYYGGVRAVQAGHSSPQLDVKRGATYWDTNSRPYSYLMSFLAGLTDAGIRVVHVHNKESAIAWILSTHTRYTKPWDKHKLFDVLQQPAKAKKKAQSMIESLLPDEREAGLGIAGRQFMKTAASFSNISYDRALILARHFRSIRAMVDTPADEMVKMKIPGIGKGIARQLVTEIRRERK